MSMTRNGAGGDPNLMNGFRDRMQEMMARQEARIQDMLNTHKEEIERHVNQLFGERSSPRRSGGGGGDNSVRSGLRGESDTRDQMEMEEEVKEVRCTYQDFKGCHPPTYDGTPNPLVLLEWVIEMEMTFKACQCSSSQKTNFAITTLRDEAFEWWLNYEQTANPEEVNRLDWGDFLEDLKKWFCTTDEIRQLEEGFLSFKKGNLTLFEYNSRFRSLMNFFIRLVPDENAKVVRYIEGLSFDIQTGMTDLTTLRQAMKRASSMSRRMEDKEKSKVGRDSCKRKLEETLKGKDEFKKPKIWMQRKNGDGKFKPLGEVTCYKCGENGHYANQCPNGTKCFECKEFGHISSQCSNKDDGKSKMVKKDDLKKPKTLARSKGRNSKIKPIEEVECFKCGEIGHMANKCPSRAKCFECNEKGHLSYNCPNKEDGSEVKKKGEQKAKGRAFQMNAVETREETDTDSGTFLVNSLVVTLLIDQGVIYFCIM